MENNKLGRPKVEMTLKRIAEIERAKKTERSVRAIDFDTVDMTSENEKWTDKMGKSVFTNDGTPHSSRGVSKVVRISSKSSVRNSPTANRFR